MADDVSTTTADALQTPGVHSDANPAAPAKARRKKLLAAIAATVLLVGGGYGAWYVLVGRTHVKTDNAYVAADVAQVTPMVAGQVAAVLVSDTQMVRRGDVLVRINDRDARIALLQAEAELAKARRQYGRTSATSTALSAQVQVRGAAIESARAQLAAAEAAYAKAKVDYDRRQKLAPDGAVSGEELTAAVNALAAARGGLDQARAGVALAQSARGAAAGDLAANDALIDGTTETTNPDVLAAQARVEQARLDLERTEIRAPVDGVVTSRAVQLGQRIAPGSTVMRVVPVSQLYVDANFKEGQLRRIRPGQPVKLTSDMYGGDVVYHGRVAGFAGGTGSAFALIPAQNATGNWVKVVQRLPVRVTLDPQELAAHPLRVGVSMSAVVDTARR